MDGIKYGEQEEMAIVFIDVNHRYQLLSKLRDSIYDCVYPQDITISRSSHLLQRCSGIYQTS
jgi:hypothetical protein